MFFKNPPNGAADVVDAWREPVGCVGSPAGDDARRVSTGGVRLDRVRIDWDRGARGGEVGCDGKVDRIVVLGDFDPVWGDPFSVASGGAVPVVAFLCGLVEREAAA